MKRKNSFSLIGIILCLLIVSTPFAYAQCPATDEETAKQNAAILKEQFFEPLLELGLTQEQIKTIADAEFPEYSNLVFETIAPVIEVEYPLTTEEILRETGKTAEQVAEEAAVLAYDLFGQELITGMREDIIARHKSSFRAALEEGRLLLAVSDGNVVGLAELDDTSIDGRILSLLGVSDSVRGQGIGTQLMDQAIIKSIADGKTTVTLSPLESAGNFYNLYGERRVEGKEGQAERGFYLRTYTPQDLGEDKFIFRIARVEGAPAAAAPVTVEGPRTIDAVRADDAVPKLQESDIERLNPDGTVVAEGQTQQPLSSEGQYGEVFLVRERATGKLYAEKAAKSRTAQDSIDREVPVFDFIRSNADKVQGCCIAGLEITDGKATGLDFRENAEGPVKLYTRLITRGGRPVTLEHMTQNAQAFQRAVTPEAWNNLETLINSLHAMGLRVGEITPRNILIDDQGNLHLIDLGTTFYAPQDSAAAEWDMQQFNDFRKPELVDAGVLVEEAPKPAPVVEQLTEDEQAAMDDLNAVHPDATLDDMVNAEKAAKNSAERHNVKAARVAPVVVLQAGRIRDQEIGGDHLQAKQEGDEVRFGIYDVTGHGVAASGAKYILTDAIAKAEQANADKIGRDFLDGYAQSVNSQMYDANSKLKSPKFTQSSMGVLGTKTGMLWVSNAGHKAIVIRNGRVLPGTLSAEAGDALGRFEKRPAIKSIQLQAGDMVLLVSDGILDTLRDLREKTDIFAAIEEIVKENPDANPNDLQKKIMDNYYEGVRQGKEPEVDDKSLLIIEAPELAPVEVAAENRNKAWFDANLRVGNLKTEPGTKLRIRTPTETIEGRFEAITDSEVRVREWDKDTGTFKDRTLLIPFGRVESFQPANEFEVSEYRKRTVALDTVEALVSRMEDTSRTIAERGNEVPNIKFRLKEFEDEAPKWMPAVSPQQREEINARIKAIEDKVANFEAEAYADVLSPDEQQELSMMGLSPLTAFSDMESRGYTPEQYTKHMRLALKAGLTNVDQILGFLRFAGERGLTAEQALELDGTEDVVKEYNTQRVKGYADTNVRTTYEPRIKELEDASGAEGYAYVPVVLNSYGNVVSVGESITQGQNLAGYKEAGFFVKLRPEAEGPEHMAYTQTLAAEQDLAQIAGLRDIENKLNAVPAEARPNIVRKALGAIGSGIGAMGRSIASIWRRAPAEEAPVRAPVSEPRFLELEGIVVGAEIDGRVHFDFNKLREITDSLIARGVYPEGTNPQKIGNRLFLHEFYHRAITSSQGLRERLAREGFNEEAFVDLLARRNSGLELSDAENAQLDELIKTVNEKGLSPEMQEIMRTAVTVEGYSDLLLGLQRMGGYEGLLEDIQPAEFYNPDGTENDFLKGLRERKARFGIVAEAPALAPAAEDTAASQVTKALVDAGYTEALEQDFENRLAQRGISYASLVEAQRTGKLEELAPDFFENPNKYLTDTGFWTSLQRGLMRSIKNIADDMGAPALDDLFTPIEIGKGAFGLTELVKTADGRHLVRKKLISANARDMQQFKKEARTYDYVSRLGLEGMPKMAGIELTPNGRDVAVIYQEFVGDAERFIRGEGTGFQGLLDAKQAGQKISESSWQRLRNLIQKLNLAGVVHNDLRQVDNIMVGEDGEVVLIDFGASQNPEDTASLARDENGMPIYRKYDMYVLGYVSSYGSDLPNYNNVDEMIEIEYLDFMHDALVNDGMIVPGGVEVAPVVVEETPVAEEEAPVEEAEVPIEAPKPAPALEPSVQRNVDKMESELADAIRASGQRDVAFLTFHVDKDTGEIWGIGDNTPESIKSAVNVQPVIVKVSYEGLDLATLTFDQIRNSIESASLENRPEFTREAKDNYAAAINAVKAEVPAINTEDIVEEVVGLLAECT